MPTLDAVACHRLGPAFRLASAELGEESGAGAPLSGTASPRLPLVPGERVQWRALPPGPRRRDWLLGRAALKRLLGAATDTSLLAFPHPRLSLTHAGGRAFAAQALGSDVVGTGVDYEPHRSSADPRAARFFLRPAERAHASGTDGLLRLWTVKEALFKATPDNAEAVLLDYELTNPGSPSGEATGPRGEQMRYLTVDTGGGLLTVAVCLATPGERRRAAV